MEPRGTYRADFLNLLSLRADKSFRLNGSRRASIIAEVHNVLNSSAGQSSFGTVTRGFAEPGGVRRPPSGRPRTSDACRRSSRRAC